MVSVEALSKSFSGKKVLDNITAEFYQGKTNLIIGASGSGKTVLLKCLLGIFTPDEGKISFDGKNVLQFTRKELENFRSEIGTVFQASALFDSMTVEENVRFPLDMFSKLTLSEKKDRVDEVLKRVNLIDAHKKYPSELSGGMQKRVAIARAIVNNPKYLFCDEPNSGLDPYTAILIDQLIHEITIEYNTTTIINSHDMNSVMEIGENIIFLKNGKLEWQGNKSEIFTADNQHLINFVFSSNLYKRLRKAVLAGG